jgi:hypothetical protein
MKILNTSIGTGLTPATVKLCRAADCRKIPCHYKELALVRRPTCGEIRTKLLDNSEVSVRFDRGEQGAVMLNHRIRAEIELDV